jgi:hypothetical protein
MSGHVGLDRDTVSFYRGYGSFSDQPASTRAISTKTSSSLVRERFSVLYP